MSITEIAIIGLGGVGGYFGFKLAQTYENHSQVKITFIARNPTYEMVRKNGLTILSPEYPINNTSRPERLLENVKGIAKADIVVICVKEYDLESVCIQLRPIIKKNTFLLPLMNGVDIYERIRKIIWDGIVFPACVYVASHIKEKGTIEHQGKPGLIVMGKDPKFSDFVPAEVITIFERAGIQIEYSEDSFPDIWEKFVFIASFGMVSARYNKSIGQIIEDPVLHGKALSIMMEIVTIAESKGIVLPQNITELTFQKADLFPYHTPTSLQIDIQSKKPQNELELFAGAIIKYGEELGIPVLATKKIYEEIKKQLGINLSCF
jgi:2-dehydropantoate 2-reductase